MIDDVKLYIPVKYRKRDRDVSLQEMLFVLHNVKRLTTGWERKIMDSIIAKIEDEIWLQTNN